MRSTTILTLLTALLAGCSSPRPFATTIGTLRPGARMTVRVAAANVGVYQPAIGEPRTKFTVAATALGNVPPAAPHIAPEPGGIAIDAPDPLAQLLLRVPDGVRLDLRVGRGHVELTNLTGSAIVHDDDGDVQILVPGTAQASVGTGSIRATLGATHWRGTLHFSARTGNVTVWINEKARFVARLHTDRGTLFSDFNLRGNSSGTSETIDEAVNGGSKRAVQITVHSGSIRLLRLSPQA